MHPVRPRWLEAASKTIWRAARTRACVSVHMSPGSAGSLPRRRDEGGRPALPGAWVPQV